MGLALRAHHSKLRGTSQILLIFPMLFPLKSLLKTSNYGGLIACLSRCSFCPRILVVCRGVYALSASVHVSAVCTATGGSVTLLSDITEK